MRTCLLGMTASALIALAVSVHAQPPADPANPQSASRPGSPARLGPPAPSGPTPRLPDGKPDLSGVWSGGGPVGDLADGLAKGETIPLLPGAKKIMDARQS